ncbi:hypothetical protein P5G51_003745 [Virgibacillus sp. 179-BFC.A HS]|uniref:Ribulokinase n=1 Tax=Tigheibacillus jepli TaxID=3035914 RepID=A0ABU5CFJ1_9BACI|nr:hypothetical protein [Virgibacillus sp. 179-BFC.A HS]MDY0404637.1 hypothetical protein [Virgibacillus sp. 179-BFC.A HS]
MNLPIHVSATDYAPAVGAAILGAVSAGEYETIPAAVEAMRQPFLKTYKPVPEHVSIYSKLFVLYKELHDEMGYKKAHRMKELKSISKANA